MYTFGDLFAGIGGVALGFESAGMFPMWANEMDPQACITYRRNFGHKLIEGDIHNISPDDLESIDVLCGGFPCQAFSVAGYRKGFGDDRGNLFFEIMRLAEKLSPRVLFLENVKNLRNHDDGNTFRVISECLKDYGYKWIHDQVLNTYEYSSLPQNRERIFIVAFKDEEAHDAFSFPDKTKEVRKVQDFLDRDVDDMYYYTHSKYYPLLSPSVTDPESIYQLRRVYVRESKKKICPTLTANMGTGGHNVPLIIDHRDIRKLTPRECLRLQGFPDSYCLPNGLSNSALYKQIGNSVSVPVIEAIANNIRLALEHSDQKLVKVAA